MSRCKRVAGTEECLAVGGDALGGLFGGARSSLGILRLQRLRQPGLRADSGESHLMLQRSAVPVHCPSMPGRALPTPSSRRLSFCFLSERLASDHVVRKVRRKSRSTNIWSHHRLFRGMTWHICTTRAHALRPGNQAWSGWSYWSSSSGAPSQVLPPSNEEEVMRATRTNLTVRRAPSGALSLACSPSKRPIGGSSGKTRLCPGFASRTSIWSSMVWSWS